MTKSKRLTKKIAKENMKQNVVETAKESSLPTPVYESFIQYNGNEVSYEKIVEKATEEYIGKGNTRESIKEMKMYIKPEENAVYYVVNGIDSGKVAFI